MHSSVFSSSNGELSTFVRCVTARECRVPQDTHVENGLALGLGVARVTIRVRVGQLGVATVGGSGYECRSGGRVRAWVRG
eukprot:535505-Amorphochlora_amoeboformis.AAC.1